MTTREAEILGNIISRIQRARIEDEFESCILDLATDTSLLLQEGVKEKLRIDEAFKQLILTR